MSTAYEKSAVPEPPKYLRPKLERMPPELKLLKNWVLWVPIWNGSKWTKRPIQISGFGASTTNPQHWSSFDDVKQAYERAIKRGYIDLYEKNKPLQKVPVGGVGFVFDGQPDENGLVLAGIDFDKGISPKKEISSFAAERIKRLGFYTELSVSGTGLHVIVKARPLPSAVAHDGVEMYTAGRYFTMTGCVSENARIVAAPDEFAALAEELQNEAGRLAGQKAQTPPRNKLPDWMLKSKPPAAFGDPADESLSDGLLATIEEIRSAVMAIPPLAISTEPEWMRLARALAHQAARIPKQREELEQILDEVSRDAMGYNKEENRERFQRYIDEASDRENPITIATIFHIAQRHGWQGGPTPTAAPPAIVWSAADLQVSLSDIPHRHWLYGTYLIRGEITVLAAPGGAGKTALATAVAVEIAAGYSKLGEKLWKSNDQKVLYINGEDGRTEIARRLWAFCQEHKISEQDIARLSVAAADDPRVQSMSFLRVNERATIVNEDGFRSLQAALETLRPDLVVVDPLVIFCGGGNMNDNALMSLVMRKLKALAVRFDCAMLIVHHTRKGRSTGDDPAEEAERIGGAAAIVNLARRALMPVTMTEAETKAYPSSSAV